MIFTVIPAKPFSEGKSRLKAVLSLSQRIKLNKILLKHTIITAKKISTVVVVSRSKQVQNIAKQCGAWSIVETEPNLNAAVEQGLNWVEVKGAKAALVLPIDLPALDVPELQSIINWGLQTHPSMVITPCRRNEGTNALFLSPPTLFKPQFGRGSFIAHQQAAKAINLTPKIYHSPKLALDLDIYEDWQQLNKESLTLNKLYSTIDN